MTGLARRIAQLAGLACVAFAPWAWANSVELDRHRIAQNETVTLTIDIDDPSSTGFPDPAELTHDFAVVGQSTSQQVDVSAGRVFVSMQLSLKPLHAGIIEIPTAGLTGQNTAPLRLEVTPVRDVAPGVDPSAPATQSPVFLQASVDTTTPYVQQSVGYTLRMYYDIVAVPQGELLVDPPSGASLIATGDDRMTTVQSGNRSLRVVERHYLLVPEHSGELQVPAPHFDGQVSTPYNFGGDPVRVAGPSIALQVRPLPANAPQPWLPLRAAQLKYRVAPKALREGEAATVELELVATGATAASLPTLTLSGDAGAQIIPERAETKDGFVDGSPQATARRRFTVVPVRSGTLRLVAPRVVWWDTATGSARVAELPPLVLPVAAGTSGGAGSSATGRGAATRGGFGAWLAEGGWHWLVVALPAMWLTMGLTLWAVRRRRLRAMSPPPLPVPPPLPGSTSRVAPPPAPIPEPTSAPAPVPVQATALAQALAQGDLVVIGAALIMAAPVPCRDLDTVRDGLDDPSQRAAIDALQLARWGGGDARAACDALRQAFADGPRWRAPPRNAQDALLPPLYPQG